MRGSFPLHNVSRSSRLRVLPVPVLGSVASLNLAPTRSIPTLYLGICHLLGKRHEGGMVQIAFAVIH